MRNLVDHVSSPLDEEEKRAIAFATIEALNMWGMFARAFFLSCALGARDPNGARIVTNAPIANYDDAITFAVHAAKPQLRAKKGPWTHWDEPTWHDTHIFLSLMTQLSPNNLGSITGAMGYPTTVFRDLPTCRNFFAHRCEATAVKVSRVARRNGINPSLRPMDVLSSRLAQRPQNVLADWIDDLRTIIELMTL